MQQDQLFSLTEYGRRLVTQNIRLAHHMSNKLRRPSSITKDEWDSEMQLALIKSVAYYDPNRGAAISTFCCRSMLYHACSLRKRLSSRRKRGAVVPVDPAAESVSGAHARPPAIDLAGQEIYLGLMDEISRVHDGDMLLSIAIEGTRHQHLADQRGFSIERLRQRLDSCRRKLRTNVRCQKLAADC